MSKRTSAYRRRDDFVLAIERELARFGIDDFAYETRKNNHRSVVIRHNGRQRFVVFPFSSRNWFGPQETAAQVRRTIREMGAWDEQQENA